MGERYWYRMNDAAPNGVMPIARDEAPSWNQKGAGIFWTVNAFKTPERRIENLERICAWAIDLDMGTKSEQRERIQHSPLVPSLIVEVKRGYHVYWGAKDGASPANWNSVVLDRLVPRFGADKNARDLARILRVPGFYHLKDPKDPFLVSIAYKQQVTYRETDMLRAFRPPAKIAEDRAAHEEVKRAAGGEGGDDFWERVWTLDCEEALKRISGHSSVNGERFSFRRVGNGNLNVFVNGKGTSCWIDKYKRIGSLSRGGPTVATWIKWYGHSWKDTAKVIRDVFPEVTA